MFLSICLSIIPLSLPCPSNNSFTNTEIPPREDWMPLSIFHVYCIACAPPHISCSFQKAMDGIWPSLLIKRPKLWTLKEKICYVQRWSSLFYNTSNCFDILLLSLNIATNSLTAVSLNKKCASSLKSCSMQKSIWILSLTLFSVWFQRSHIHSSQMQVFVGSHYQHDVPSLPLM